jgi:hypothetical protein
MIHLSFRSRVAVALIAALTLTQSSRAAIAAPSLDAYPLALRALAVNADADTSEDPALPPADVRGWQTALFRPDRVQHASMSLTLALAAGLATRDAAIGLGVSLCLGLAKELHDIGGSGFDPLDLVADTIGAGGGAAAASAVIH